MYCWQIIFVSLILVIVKSDRDNFGQHYYTLKYNQIKVIKVEISGQMRISMIQHLGQSRLTILENGQVYSVTSQIIYEEIINQQPHINRELIISLSGQAIISKGLIIIQPYLPKSQILLTQSEKYVYLKKNQQRVFIIHPKTKVQMMIERFDGIPNFIVNRCKIYEQKECYDQMHRFTPQQMKKHIQSLILEECSNCMVMFKLSTRSDISKIRLSFLKEKMIIPQYPNMILIKKQQTFQIKTYKVHNAKGRIFVYSGKIEINSNQTILFTNFTNGYFFQFSNIEQDNNTSNNDTLRFSIKGLKQLSYLIIEYPINETNITLIDGFVSTVYVQADKQYIINYQNHNRGKANVVISSSSQILQRVSLKFTTQQQEQNYLIRPKLLFNQSTASQNFQLDQSKDKIHISMHLISGLSGFLNISAQVHQLITIPLDYKYSSILYYKQYDQYIIEGITGNVQINIQKCVDCSLKYSISEQYIESSAVKQITNLSLSQTFRVHKNELYIRIQTGNYAFYSIYVTKTIKQNMQSAIIQQKQIKFYLTDTSQNSLLIQFYPPLCNQKLCPNVTYYLMESSNQKHLSSKLYCPSQLFDFDQNIKDLIIQVIHPENIGQLMSFTRLIKHRDFIGIAAFIDGKLLPYKIINIEEVRSYKEIKWPLFFITIFIFLALFCSFVIFMALRKGKQQQIKGYKRIPSDNYNNYKYDYLDQ